MLDCLGRGDPAAARLAELTMDRQDPTARGVTPRPDPLADFKTQLAALPDLGNPYADERSAIERLLVLAPADALRHAGAQRALHYIGAVRGAEAGWLSAQNLLASFPLASAEGVALLRLAEALLRAPDPETQTWLIAEKLAAFKEAQAAGDGLVQRVLSTALRIAGHTSSEAELQAGGSATSVRAWLSRTALRPLVIDGIRRFGEQFVFAPDLRGAISRASRRTDPREVYSYDMLGEGARTAADARRNFDAYAQAIAALKSATQPGPWQRRDGISVKLSAIHPRFETLQLDRVHAELYPSLLELARAAAGADINFTIDAEESERLVLQIALLDRLMGEPSLAGWEGLGLALQAYMPRAINALDHLLARSAEQRRALAVRVVKGAYWDAEIKRAHELGMPGFPVYTRKWATDMSYVALAARLLATTAPVYPQFATHNAMTVATLVELAREHPTRAFEFQRLHGMGAPLYATVMAEEPQVLVRVYAPVGEFRDLLAYLVRRLLENGANTSFVHQISDASVAPASLVDDPFERAGQALLAAERLPALDTADRLFADRVNSRGIDVQHPPTLAHVLAAAATPPLEALPAGTPIRNPAKATDVVGVVQEATAIDASTAVARAHTAFTAWSASSMAVRAALLDAAAVRMEADHDALIALLQREAGKTLLDAHLEVREAVDFLRYYAQQARALGGETRLPGPAGESNTLRIGGRGVFVCISPWNFPLAIFLGQVTAALAAGNAVIAKPAEQTPLVAAAAVRCCTRRAYRFRCWQLVPGNGSVGAALTGDPRIAGVAFTGSTETAWAINRTLAAAAGPSCR
jgi:RHH-type transcriptional regulator, proline utilization regulon repressor / proline dehydrogenase / delta 1-pyrroline-5-carboxylate dehydrogenase